MSKNNKIRTLAYNYMLLTHRYYNGKNAEQQ